MILCVEFFEVFVVFLSSLAGKSVIEGSLLATFRNSSLQFLDKIVNQILGPRCVWCSRDDVVHISHSELLFWLLQLNRMRFFEDIGWKIRNKVWFHMILQSLSDVWLTRLGYHANKLGENTCLRHPKLSDKISLRCHQTTQLCGTEILQVSNTGSSVELRRYYQRLLYGLTISRFSGSVENDSQL